VRAVNFALLAVAVALGAAGAVWGERTLSAGGFALAVVALALWVLRSMRGQPGDGDGGGPGGDSDGGDGG